MKPTASLSDQVERHIVWVCCGCDKCQPLDGSKPQDYPCTDTSPSMDGAEVVLAKHYDRLREALEQIAGVDDPPYPDREFMGRATDRERALQRIAREALASGKDRT